MKYIENSDRIWIQNPGEPQGRWISLNGCIVLHYEFSTPDQIRGIAGHQYIPTIEDQLLEPGWLEWALLDDTMGMAIAIEEENGN